MKKRAIKVLSATAVAASAFVATVPAQAASTDVVSLVKKAKEAGTVLKWAISTEGSADGTTRPWNQYNAAKTARDKAVAAIKKLPASQQAAYLADIEQNVTLHITRAMHYIDAITAGEKIKAKKEVLDAQIAQNLIDDKTEAAYHTLSTEIRKQAVLLDRVYGQTTRDAIRAQYKVPAEKVRDSVKYEVTVKIELDLAKKAIVANNYADAEKHIADATKYLKEVKNEVMKATLVKTLDELEAQMTPKISSVNAVNAKEVVVKFNKPIDAASVIASNNLKAGVFKLNNAEANTLTSGASLSKDGKTLTLVSKTKWDGSFSVESIANQIKTLDNKNVAVYKSFFTVSDATRAEVTGVTYVDKFTYDIEFSEPVKSTGTLAFSYTDGTSTAISATGTLSADKKSVRVAFNPATLLNKEISVTLPSMTDFAGNVSKPAVAKVTISDADKEKPAISSVKTTGFDGTKTSFQIKLSEAVKETTVDSITVNGAAVTASVDAKDKTVINATVAGKIKGDVLVYIAAGAITDLNGNKNAEVGQFFNFAQDEALPTVESQKVERIGGVEHLVLTFSEEISKVVAPASLAFTSVDQYGMPVTTTINTPAVSMHNVVDGKTKQIKVSLAGLADSTAYKVTFAAGLVVDGYNNASAEIKDASFSTTTVNTGEGSNNTATIEAAPATPGKLTVSFSKPVNVESAQNVANYSVEDATVASAKVTTNGAAGAIVELTLADDTVEATGNYNVTVQPIKTFNSLDVANPVTTASVTLKENVRSVLSSKVLTNLTADALGIKLTFDDATVTNGAGLDFELYVNGVATGKKLNVADLSPSVAGSFQATWSDTNNSVTDLLTATSVKLVAVDTLDIKDATGNKVKASEIVIK